MHCNCLTSVGMSLMYPPSCVYTLDETYMSFWLPFAPTLVLCALRVLCVYEEAACVQTSRTLLVFTPMNPCSSPVKILDLPEYICTESFTIYFRRSQSATPTNTFSYKKLFFPKTYSLHENWKSLESCKRYRPGIVGPIYIHVCAGLLLPSHPS